MQLAAEQCQGQQLLTDARNCKAQEIRSLTAVKISLAASTLLQDTKRMNDRSYTDTTVCWTLGTEGHSSLNSSVPQCNMFCCLVCLVCWKVTASCGSQPDRGPAVAVLPNAVVSHASTSGDNGANQSQQSRGTPVRILLVDAIEELQEATAYITGDSAHHPKVVVYQPATILSIHSNVAWVRICRNTYQ